MQVKLNSQKLIQLLAIAAALIFAFVHVLTHINPQLIHFTQQQAFLTTWNFFIRHLAYPGGLGHYFSLFFEQFFQFPIAGSLIMVSTVLLTALVSAKVCKKAISEYGLLTLFLIPLLLSLLLWQNLEYPFFINVQLLITFLLTWVSQLLQAKPKLQLVGFALLGIILYWVSGAPYLYLFAGIIVVHWLMNKNGKEMYWVFLFVVLALFIPLVFYRSVAISSFHAFLRFDPRMPLFLYYKHNGLLYILFAYLPAYLLINKFIWQKIKLFRRLPNLVNAALVIIVFGILVQSFNARYSKREQHVVANMAYYSWQKDWNKVVRYSNKLDVYSRMVNFYMNQALYYQGLMGTHLFQYRQLLGIHGLFVDEPLVGNICMPASYFYRNLGLINNALRFAYESQTLLPNSPYVLMEIIDGLLLTHDFENARTFINQLNKNFLFSDFVKDRLAYITGEKSTLNKKEAQKISRFKPAKDFYTSDPIANIYFLAHEDSGNKMAHEYYLSYCLLNNKLGEFARFLVEENDPEQLQLKAVYQQALILYLALSKGKFIAGAERIPIDKKIKNDFMQFHKTLRKQGRNLAMNELYNRFGSTYWFYAVYDNPEVTKAKVKTRKATVNY